MEPELIADYACVVGEGPLWHPVESRLYWADIPKGRLFRYDPATGEHGEFYNSGDRGMIGGFTFQADGSLLLFMEKGAVAVLRGGELSYVIEELPGESENRFNDVFTDTAGRVFCGTMSAVPERADVQRGTLYRLDTDGSITPVVTGTGICNGMGLTPDGRQMYWTDTIDATIYLFDYDAETGELSDQRVFAKAPADEGGPDGMTVDADGYVWSARWGGSCVVRYSPEGVEERRVGLPVPKVSSVTFGGPDYTDMYITTAGGDKKAEDGEGAGALYRVNAGVRGVPEFLSRVGL